MSLTLHSLQRSLKGFDIRQEVVESIMATREDVAELNRGQMFLGRRADGSEILPTYSDMTIEIKKEKGQPFDRQTLKDTGDFWNSIEVDVNSQSFSIYARDWKTEKLVKKYGQKIFGLSRESKYEEYVPNYFFPELKRRIELKTVLRLS